MLDTKAKARPKTNKLKLLDIDYDHFVDNNLPTLVTYLEKEYLPSWRETHDANTPPRFVKDYLAINTAGNLALTDDGDDEPIYGFNQNINIAKRNLSVENWAQIILEHYTIWLKKQEKKQSQLSPAKLAEIANKYNTADPLLFTAPNYNNWILTNLDHFTDDEVSLRMAYLDLQFIDKLLIRLNSIKQIKSSLVSYLLINISDNYHDFDYTVVCEVIKKLYQIALNKDDNVQMIIDKRISLPQLVLNTCEIKTTPKRLIAPVYTINDIAKINLAVFNTYGIKINFKITNKDDLQQFLRKLLKRIINTGQIDALDVIDQLTTHRIKLDKYQKTLQEFLDATSLILGKDDYVVHEISNICKAIFE